MIVGTKLDLVKDQSQIESVSPQLATLATQCNASKILKLSTKHDVSDFINSVVESLAFVSSSTYETSS